MCTCSNRFRQYINYNGQVSLLSVSLPRRLAVCVDLIYLEGVAQFFFLLFIFFGVLFISLWFIPWSCSPYVSNTQLTTLRAAVLLDREQKIQIIIIKKIYKRGPLYITTHWPLAVVQLHIVTDGTKPQHSQEKNTQKKRGLNDAFR